MGRRRPWSAALQWNRLSPRAATADDRYFLLPLATVGAERSYSSKLKQHPNDNFDYRRAHIENDLVRMTCTLPLEFTPGQRYYYSNAGYLLLGVILDRVGRML